MECQKFKVELERTKDLVDRIPKPEINRTLHPDTEKLGFHGRLEFIQLGNDLLVCLNKEFQNQFLKNFNLDQGTELQPTFGAPYSKHPRNSSKLPCESNSGALF